MKPLRIAVALVCWTVVPAWSWDTVLPGDGQDGNGASLAVRADGDVVVAHCVRMSDASHSRKIVERLSGTTGAQRWQTVVERLGYCSNPRVIVTAEGDPIVSDPLARLSGEDGSIVWSSDVDGVSALAVRGDGVLIVTTGSPNLVSALDAQTGDMLWSHPLDLRPGHIAIQVSGDVVVTAHGHGTSQPPPNPFAVVALDGTTGAERWRYTAFGTADYINWNNAGAIVVDATGDVVAAGFLGNSIAPSPPLTRDWDAQPFVAKLSGDAGAELWSRLLLLPTPGDAYVDALAITPDGDAVVGINSGGVASPEIARLAGSTGAERWRAAWLANPDSANGDYLETVALDAADDVIALGSSFDRVAVAKYAGSTGESLWLRSLVAAPDPQTDQIFAEAMALGPQRDIIIAGSILKASFKLRFHVIGFRDAVAARRLLVRDDGTQRTVRIVLRDPRIQPALAGGPGDPQLTGASLTLASSTGGAFTIALSADGWAPIGTRGGFTYQGADDGCTVKIKPAVLRARCTSTDSGFTLAQPAGQVSVRLRIDTPGGFSQCATFGGTVLTDRAVAPGKPGRFEAENAPAPASCD